MIAGRVAEVVTGKEYSALMRELLLDPVGATSTSYPSENMQKMPAAYERTSEGLRAFQGEPFGSVINPGGGLAGTLDGVGRFLMLHRNRGNLDGRQIVSADALARMYVPHPASKGREYGLGFNVLRQRPDGTAGRVMHIGGSGTLVLIDLDQDLIIVVLTQVGSQDIQWRRQILDHWSKLTGKPLFHADTCFSVPYRQMPAPIGAVCPDQETRARRFLNSASRSLSRPDVIGYNWCGWMDMWAEWRDERQHSGLQNPFGRYHDPMPETMARFGAQLYQLGRRGER